eukprot:3713512-Amphidinium_carterae.1
MVHYYDHGSYSEFNSYCNRLVLAGTVYMKAHTENPGSHFLVGRGACSSLSMLAEVVLSEVVRCSKRIVAGCDDVMSFERLHHAETNACRIQYQQYTIT